MYIFSEQMLSVVAIELRMWIGGCLARCRKYRHFLSSHLVEVLKRARVSLATPLRDMRAMGHGTAKRRGVGVS